MDPIEYRQWQTTRSQGRRKYVWRRGVLGFGLPLCCALYVADVLQYLLGWKTSMHWIPMAVVFVAMVIPAGMLFGRWTWAIREREFHHQKLS